MHAQWMEVDGLWDIEAINMDDKAVFHETCHILVNATGYLNKWSWPSVPGIEKFRGQIAHSASWNSTIDLHDKNVTLVGNGYALLTAE